MNSGLNRDQVGGMLFDIFSVAAERRPNHTLAPILLFLQAIRPKSIDLVVILAWEMLRERRFDRAKSLLEVAEFEHPRSASIKAALATVSYFSGDISWRGYLSKMDKLEHSEEASMVAAALEAAVDAGLDPAESFIAFKARTQLIEVITLNHPELITK